MIVVRASSATSMLRVSPITRQVYSGSAVATPASSSNDIIIGNLKAKKNRKKPPKWSAPACQRRYRPIVPRQELQLQKTRKTCDQIRVKAEEGGIRGQQGVEGREGGREGDKERSRRNGGVQITGARNRSCGRVNFRRVPSGNTSTFAATCYRARVGALQTFYRSPLSSPASGRSWPYVWPSCSCARRKLPV